MANEFKIKKGLIVTGASGGTVVDIQGSQGQLFSVTDDLSGSIFAVSDISGVPILNVNSSGLVTVDGPFTQTGGGATILSGTLNVEGVSTLANVGYLGDGLGSVQYTFQSANDGFATIDFGDVADSNIGRLSYNHNDNSFLIRTNNATALTLDSSQNATFAGNVVMANAKILYTDDIRANSGAMAVGPTGEAALTLRTFSTTRLTIASDGDATFAAQAFSAATSSGDASSTLTTKGYVDGLITGATIYRGAWDPSGGGYGSPDLSGVTQTSGYYYICSAAGTAEPNGTGTEPDTWAVGDWVIYNDVSGTGQWQKIDNSSVLSGVGTGQTVALWEGAGSVTDSETLGNAPITVSGNNATFAGDVVINSAGDATSPILRLNNSSSNTFNHALEAINDNLTAAETELLLFGKETNSRNSGFIGYNWNADNSDTNYVTIGHWGYNHLLKIYPTGTATFVGAVTSPTFLGDLNGTINTATTGVTQTAGNNSTLIATTAYADAAAAAVPIGNYLPLAGGTLTGNTNLTGSTKKLILKSGAQLGFEDAAPTGTIYLYNDGAATSRLNIGGTMWVEEAGNVGIGTTSPSAQLEISNSNAVTGQGGATLRLTRSDATSVAGDPVGTIEFYSTDADTPKTTAYIKSMSEELYGREGSLAFGVSQTINADATEAMRIDSNGNVGIGTTSPDNILHIRNGDTTYASQVGADTMLFLETTNVSNALQFTSANTGQQYIMFGDDDPNVGWVSYNHSDNNLNFRVNGSEKMRISTAGNVGIGTTSPTAKLHVANEGEGEFAGGNSSAAGDSHLMLKDEGGTSRTLMSGPSIVFQTPANADGTNVWATSRLLGSPAAAGSARGTFSIQVRDNYDPLSDGTSWNWRTALTAINTGNVGIGTNSPVTKLQVAGGIQMADDTATASANKAGTMRYRTGTEYVEVDGVELVTNGDFATDTDWTKGANTTISGGTLNSTAIGVYVIAKQSGVVSQNLYYKWTVTYTITSGGIRLGDSNNVWAGSDQTASGTYTGFVQAASTADGYLYMTSPSSNFIGSVDNISVLEVTEEDASYADMCMQTGSSTYEWVNIVKNTY